MRTLLIVETGFQSYKEPILKSLSQVDDVRLVLAVGLSAIIDSSWAGKYADETLTFTYRDEKSLLSAVRAYEKRTHYRIDGVATWVEPSVAVANDLAHQLGVPALSTFRGGAVRSKRWVRERLRERGVEQVPFWVLESEAQLNTLQNARLPFPLIVKPCEMMSSLGVFRVNTFAELQAAFLKARSADFWEENLREIYPSISNDVLLESYVEGPEYSIEAVTQGGNTRLLGITKKWTQKEGGFDETAHSFPAQDLSEAVVSRIERLVCDSHSALQILNGLTHSEVRIKEGVPFLIEINCRLGGDFISELVERSTGLSVGRLLCDTHLGSSTPFAIQSASPQSVAFLTTRKEGRIVEIDSKSLENPGVEFRQHAQLGDLLYRGGVSGLSRLGAYFKAGEPHAVNDLENAFSIQPPLSIDTLRSDDDTLLTFQSMPGDLESFLRVEQASWDQSQRASAETMAKRLELHPQTHFLAYSLKQRKPVGFISAVAIERRENGGGECWQHYADLAAQPGKAKEVLQTLYIVSISVVPEAPRGTGTTLVKVAGSYCETEGLSALCYGIRVPGYSAHANEGLSFDAYYQGLLSNRYHEPLMKLARNSKGVPLRPLENYFSDPPSCDYGILIQHRFRVDQ